MKISALKLSKGKKHWVTAAVSDPTKWVLDPDAKKTYLTQKITWTVNP